MFVAALYIDDLHSVEVPDLFWHILTDRVAMAESTTLTIAPGIDTAMLGEGKTVRLA